MSGKNNDKGNPVILNEKKLDTKTKAENPFKHLRAIPTGALNTNTSKPNPFLAGKGNQDEPEPDKTKKPVSKE